MDTPAFKAAGTIQPCRIVSLSDNATQDFTVEETATTALELLEIGISGESGKDGRHDVNNTAHAEAGDTVQVFGVGEVCLLEMAATCSRGQRLKANTSTDGKGIPVAASGKESYVAIALQDCTHSSQKIRVQVVLGNVYT